MFKASQLTLKSRNLRRNVQHEQRSNRRFESPAPGRESEGDRVHTLLRALLRLRKHAPFIEKLIVAFERSNSEATSAQRRKVFYELLAEILSDL